MNIKLATTCGILEITLKSHLNQSPLPTLSGRESETPHSYALQKKKNIGNNKERKKQKTMKTTNTT